QSSTATILLIASFAGQAMISTTAALALILGADVGTTIVAQLLTFDLSWLYPVLLTSGVILFSFDKISKAKNIGRIMIGLGLVLLSLAWIRESASPLQHSETLPIILNAIGGDMLLALVIAALLTWMAHSSLAIVLLLMSLTTSGVLPVELGLIMVLGANMGGTIAPLLSTMRDAPAAFRVPAGNMVMRGIGVVAMLPFMGYLLPYLELVTTDPARQLVTFHMGFNIALALIFLPLVGVVAALCKKLFPDRIDAADPSVPRFLNHNEIDTPAIALSSAARETLRMAEFAQEMLEDTIKAFRTNDEAMVNRIRSKDDVIDKLYHALKLYMARLTQEYMDKEDADRYVQILTFATNLEHAGDIIDKNLMPLALKKIRNQGSFSTQGFKEIENIHNLVLDSLKLAQNVFISSDVDLARKMLSEKEVIRQAEITASISHIERLREKVPESIATSSLHLDIIRDYRRINSYMCTVAFPLLEEKGQLRSSRLKPKEA
ncbi:MAG: Na/Pi cotransporter family protein, partial [Alphaproteobacteria bacterium]|nr:Na/Pi cotransporter family protein [Alphaproteobacteria bacterium]